MTWMITIEPLYIQAIISGLKTIELRKFVPRGMQRGDKVIVVEKGSYNKVALRFDVSGIIVLSPSHMWEFHHSELAIDYVDYLRYTDAHALVYGIKISNVREARYNVECTYFGVKNAPQSYVRVLAEEKALSNIFWGC